MWSISFILGALSACAAAHFATDHHHQGHGEGKGGHSGDVGNGHSLIFHSGPKTYKIPGVLVGGNLTQYGLNVTTYPDDDEGSQAYSDSLGGFCPDLPGCNFNYSGDSAALQVYTLIEVYNETNYVLLASSETSRPNHHGALEVPKVQVSNETVIAANCTGNLTMSFDCSTSSDGYCFLNYTYASNMAANLTTDSVAVLTGPSS